MAPFGDMHSFVAPAVTETAFPSRWTWVSYWWSNGACHMSHGLLGLNDTVVFYDHI